MQHRGFSVRSPHLKRVVCSWMHNDALMSYHVMVPALLWLLFYFFTGRSKFGRLFSFCLVSTLWTWVWYLIKHCMQYTLKKPQHVPWYWILKTIANLALHPTEPLLFLLRLWSMSFSFATLPYVLPLTEATNKEKLPPLPLKKCLSLPALLPSSLKEQCRIII